MHVVSMLDDYRVMCKSAESDGKFEAYKAYTAKYPVLFSSVMKYLYQCPLEALREYIESSDMKKLLLQGEENFKIGKFTAVADSVSKCCTRMGIDFSFDLYLGMELGNIGGASLPTDDDSRFVYIGVDRPIDTLWQQIFVPHELHHLLRIHKTGEKESNTLRSRMVSEGLASYCPLWYYDMLWNTETVAQSLGVNEKQSGYMLDHAEELIEDLWNEGDLPLDQTVMSRYFASRDEDSDVRVPGYFAGMWFVHELVLSGCDFIELTGMDTAEILELIQRQMRR